MKLAESCSKLVLKTFFFATCFYIPTYMHGLQQICLIQITLTQIANKPVNIRKSRLSHTSQCSVNVCIVVLYYILYFTIFSYHPYCCNNPKSSTRINYFTKGYILNKGSFHVYIEMLWIIILTFVCFFYLILPGYDTHHHSVTKYK